MEEGNDTVRILFLHLSDPVFTSFLSCFYIFPILSVRGAHQYHVRYYNSDINLQFYWHEEPEDQVRSAHNKVVRMLLKKYGQRGKNPLFWAKILPKSLADPMSGTDSKEPN